MAAVDVAIASCRREPTAGPADLYPDPDAAPLGLALQRLGAAAALVSWDDSEVDWSAFARVVVSSTWDDVDRPAEYRTWVKDVSAHSVLVNSARVIEWNLDKVHQQVLGDSGVPVIPTSWIEPGESWEPPSGPFVIKPSISAGARGTARYSGANAGQAITHVQSLHQSGQTVMVQPYMESIDRDGELDLVFIAGVFSHAIRKKLLLEVGEGIVEQPWLRTSWNGPVTPSSEQVTAATKAIRIVKELLGEMPAYGRVDLVSGPNGGSFVLEIELIDPYLALDLAPEAASRLAASVLRTGATG